MRTEEIPITFILYVYGCVIYKDVVGTLAEFWQVSFLYAKICNEKKPGQVFWLKIPKICADEERLFQTRTNRVRVFIKCYIRKIMRIKYIL